MDYLSPELELIDIRLSELLCTSPGVDPDGIGEDFTWGN